MSCSVISENINIVMDAQSNMPGKSPIMGSSLQNPDISRANLGAMLRRKPRRSPKKAQNLFWSAFTAYHAEQHANCND